MQERTGHCQVVHVSYGLLDIGSELSGRDLFCIRRIHSLIAYPSGSCEAKAAL